MSNSEYQAIIHNLFQFRVHCLWTDGHACNMSLQGCTHVCDREGCICPDSQWKDSSIYGWLMQNQQGEKQCADTFPDSRRHYASRWKRPRLFLDWHFIVNCIVTCKFVQAINSISAGMLVRQQNMIITPRSSPLSAEKSDESRMTMKRWTVLFRLPFPRVSFDSLSLPLSLSAWLSLFRAKQLCLSLFTHLELWLQHWLQVCISLVYFSMWKKAFEFLITGAVGWAVAV